MYVEFWVLGVLDRDESMINQRVSGNIFQTYCIVL